jgi:hypothetical protein
LDHQAVRTSGRGLAFLFLMGQEDPTFFWTHLQQTSRPVEHGLFFHSLRQSIGRTGHREVGPDGSVFDLSDQLQAKQVRGRDGQKGGFGGTEPCIEWN